MLVDLSFLSVLTIARTALLVAGVCAVAVWATRQPDQETTLIRRLTQQRSKCADK